MTLRDKIAAHAEALRDSGTHSSWLSRHISPADWLEVAFFLPVSRSTGPSISEEHFIHAAASMFAAYGVDVPEDLPWARTIAPDQQSVWFLALRARGTAGEVANSLRSLRSLLGPEVLVIDCTPLHA